MLKERLLSKRTFGLSLVLILVILSTGTLPAFANVYTGSGTYNDLCGFTQWTLAAAVDTGAHTISWTWSGPWVIGCPPSVFTPKGILSWIHIWDNLGWVNIWQDMTNPSGSDYTMYYGTYTWVHVEARWTYTGPGYLYQPDIIVHIYVGA